MKRIFIALPISEELKKWVSDWQNRHSDLPVRWIKEKNLHITIVPPWYTDNLNLVARQLEKIKNKFGQIELHFDKICIGPTSKNPRMIWLEGETPEILPKLKTHLEAVLGLKPEKRDFLLHLTIARFNPRDFHKFPLDPINEKISWDEKISSLVLMGSRLLPQGAEYEIIASIPLL